MEDNNLLYTTALFRGFKRLQNFALDDTARHKDLDSLNKYLNPENGKSTAYIGQIVSVYDDPNGNNGIYFIVPTENGLGVSEKFATISQIEELGRQVEFAINNMVVANPEDNPEEPTIYYGLETVKIADKTYKLVKALEGEVENAKDLYAIEIAGVTYNLKTNLEDYVTKETLESIVGNLDESLDKRIDDIEKVIDRIIDIDNNKDTIDDIKTILDKINKLNPNILNILTRLDAIEGRLNSLEADVAANRASIAENYVLIAENSQDIIDAEGRININLETIRSTIASTDTRLQENINTVQENVNTLNDKIDDHINKLYGVKRVKNLVFNGESKEMEYWVTADGEKWLSIGDIVEQVSVSIISVPENFNDADYKFRFVVNGEHIITEDDIMFDELESTFEFSFNKRLRTDVNGAAFIVNIPAGASVSVIITYVIMEK